MVPRPSLNTANARPEVLLVAGTRPEAIKLAPVVSAMSKAGRIRPVVAASGQHPTMVAQALSTFGLSPDVALRLRRARGNQAELASQLIAELDSVVDQRRPAAVVVQGDTATTLIAAQVAFWRQVPVVHLEAGLRSYDLTSPFPEEANRRMVGQISSVHLAPTAEAAANLAAEGLCGPSVLTIGNTAVDAVLQVADHGVAKAESALAAVLARARAAVSKVVLVTAHRRESWGQPLDRVLRAVAELACRHPDIEVVLPTHPNPAVRAQVHALLDGVERVTITGPLPYEELAGLLSVATLVLSDSGGIQEEAPSFGVPVLVLREVTERREAVSAGCAMLVGTDQELIVRTASALLNDDAARSAMTAAGNPFGDGRAGERAEQSLAWLLGLRAHRPEEFRPSGADPELAPVSTNSASGEAVA